MDSLTCSQNWINNPLNREKYKNQWVALWCDELIAHAPTLEEVYKQTRGESRTILLMQMTERQIAAAV